MQENQEHVATYFEPAAAATESAQNHRKISSSNFISSMGGFTCDVLAVKFS
jgi:hypothetical protein